MLRILTLDLLAVALLAAAYAVHPGVAARVGMVIGFPMAAVTAIAIRP